MLPITSRDTRRTSSHSVFSTALKLLRRRLRNHIRRNSLRFVLVILLIVVWAAAQNFLHRQAGLTAANEAHVNAPPVQQLLNSSRTLAQFVSTAAESPGSPSESSTSVLAAAPAGELLLTKLGGAQGLA